MTLEKWINKPTPYNPVKQDVNNGLVRTITYGSLPYNYGALPRTWEDPNIKNENLNVEPVGGDNDPLDVIELSMEPLSIGSIHIVKIIGCIPLIDSNEVDWKMLAINVENAMAVHLHDIGDVDQERLASIMHWLRMYKTTEGKPENVIALGGKAMGREYCAGVIKENHERWEWLVANRVENIWTAKTVVVSYDAESE
jgi:inorganic pyrophosphatase